MPRKKRTSCSPTTSSIPRTDLTDSSPGDDGDDIWDHVAAGNPNVLLTFNGHHYPQHAWQRSFERTGTDLCLMFSNFQGVPLIRTYGGMFEVVSICPKLGKVAVKHYPLAV